MLLFLIISTITDLLYRKIYNTVLLPMFLISLYLHQNNLPEFFSALLISIIFITILYKLKFFAGGDAKILIIIGATVGYPNLFYLFATIFIIGGIHAILSNIFPNDKIKKLPYALSILLGYIIFKLSN